MGSCYSKSRSMAVGGVKRERERHINIRLRTKTEKIKIFNTRTNTNEQVAMSQLVTAMQNSQII